MAHHLLTAAEVAVTQGAWDGSPPEVSDPDGSLLDDIAKAQWGRTWDGMRTPLLHFDYTRKSPEGRFISDLVKEWHLRFTNQDLCDGTCSQRLDELDPTSRIVNYLMMLYDRFGQNTYVVGPKVQELFRRTNLAKITADMIRAPQSTFYLGLNDCPWKIWGGERTQWHPLTGVYVAFTKSQSYSEGSRRELGIHFALWGKANENSVTSTDDAILWYSINLEDWGRQGVDLETYFANHAVMLATEDARLAWKGGDSLTNNEPLFPTAVEQVLEQRKTLTNVLRLVFNVCLYMSSEDPDVDIKDLKREAADLKRQIQKKSPGKRKKMGRRLGNLPRTRIIYVGPLFENLPDPSESGVQRPGHQGGTHVSPIEHGVAPHWQRYWTGAGDARKVTWRLKGMYTRGTGQADRTVTKIRE